MSGDLVAYYAARAGEYDRVYDKPERQRDLDRLRGAVHAFFGNCRVLEVACGTGYWTMQIARAARSVTATDISAEMLEIAKARPQPASANITFTIIDAFDLPALQQQFDAAFAGFWWSHLRRDAIGTFLDALHQSLEPGSRVMLLDNRYVEGSSTPISRADADGNTFQRRRLTDGSEFEVLKNFPDASELRDTLIAAGATDVAYVELQYYWHVTYRCCERLPMYRQS